MPPTELALAVLALLVTPGPTNSLMLLAGAERGFSAASRLIPVELSGYVLTVLPLTLVGAAALSNHPQLRAPVLLAAAIWVATLAFRLWHRPAQTGTTPAVTAWALFVTTALNPKALIFGLVLLPSPERLVFNLAIFAALVVFVALFWVGLGAGMRQGGLHNPKGLFVFRRLTSVFLAAVSVTLALRGIRA